MPKRQSALKRWTSEISQLESKLSHPHIMQVDRQALLRKLKNAKTKQRSALKRVPKLQ
ncbi:MAG: hypothetical protein KAT00_06855 [Planctomycetes bacterium]|nr:hypothetical protein [Planctomycetota bacterium]